MVKRKDIFNDSGGIWDERIQKYRRRTWGDLEPLNKTWFDYNIARRCGPNGYQKSARNWPMASNPLINLMPDADPFLDLLEWYFPKEVAEKIFDMAFSVNRVNEWKLAHCGNGFFSLRVENRWD
jgi:hypothetical protein